MDVLLASSNAGKISEFQSLLAPLKVIGQGQLGIEAPEETGLTFVENAIIKARFASQMAKSPALSDDSGLVVEALKGEPGIYSARYSGKNGTNRQNIEFLLKNLYNVPSEKRKAYFYCVLVFLRHAEDPTPLIATGRWSGYIAEEIRGENGFGYDPIFYLPDYGCTVAELPIAIKNANSHRAKAIIELKTLLKEEGYY